MTTLSLQKILSKLVGNPRLMTSYEVMQVQRWVQEDWESHDIDRNAVELISRLANTCLQAQKDAENRKIALRRADEESTSPYCLGCGHERDEAHKADCLIYPRT